MAKTIGEQLKQAREARGWSLDQAAQVTFIRRPYLEALEEDRRDALPSNVQGRGFMRLYAGHLHMPVEPLLAIWDGKAPPDLVSPDAAEITSPPAPPAFPKAKAPAQGTAETPQPVSPTFEIAPSASRPEEQRAAPGAAAEDETPAPPPGSEAILREVGGQLRLQRESLGLTMAEVERYTRLRQHYIQALEDGRLDGLPSPVQGRGMLSNYAAFLNLDEEKLLLRFAESLQVRR